MLHTELTKEQAVALAESNFWEDMSSHEIVKFQLFTERLCMPWNVFQNSVEKELKRPVWTHEFADAELLQREFLGEIKAPTFEDVLNQIPESKRIIIVGVK